MAQIQSRQGDDLMIRAMTLCLGDECPKGENYSAAPCLSFVTALACIKAEP